MHTSEIGVIGVARLMRTHSSKPSFWSARLRSSGSGSAFADPAGAERGPQRERLAEAHHDPSVAPAEPAQDPQEPEEALALLRGALLLGRIVGDVADLVVADGGGHEHDVFAAPAPEGVHHVGEHSEARRQQLAGARAPALDVPLEREALLDQRVDVVAQDELVDLVVLEGAADEEHARAPHQRAEREEVHVDAARGVVRGQAVLVQQRLEHAVVEVRLVRGQEHHRVLLRERAQLVHLRGLVVQHLAVAALVEALPELHDQVDHEGAVRGRDLAQVGGGLAQHGRVGAAERGGEAVQLAAEGRAPEHVLVHEARHLVARAAQPALRDVEHEVGLAHDELREPDGRACVGAGAAAPALAQRRGRGRLARDDAHPLGRGAQHVVLAQPARVAWIAELQQVREARLPHAVALARLPHHA